MAGMSVLTLGGVRPEDIGLRVLRESSRPILPGTRDRTVTIDGRNGAWDFGADVEPREFNLSCAFLTRDSRQLQYHVEQLAHLLVDSYGKPRTLELVFAAHPDRTYTVRYSGNLDINRVVGMGTFSLPLIAFEPYAYGLEQVLELDISASPTQFTVASEGEIRTETKFVLTNTGTNTITRFQISNEYRLEG